MNKILFDKFCKHLHRFDHENKPKFEVESIRLLRTFLQVLIEATKNKNANLVVSVGKDGVEEQLKLLDDSSFVFHKIFINLQKYPPLNKGHDYLEVTRSFLEKNSVPLHLKVQLIFFEVSFIDQLIKQYFKVDQIGLVSLKGRLSLLSDYTQKRMDIGSFDDQALPHSYAFLLGHLSNIYTIKGQLLQCLNYLNEKLRVAKGDIEKSILLRSLVGYATSYNLLSLRELEDIVEEHSECMSEEELEFVKSEIKSDSSGIVLHAFQFSSGTLSKENTRNKNLSTFIRFSIPIECVFDKQVTIENDENKPQIVVVPIENFWSDPMFESFINFKIGNISWSYFSDLSVDTDGKFCHIIVDIKGLYIPDIELLESTSKAIDFSEKEQIEGKAYYPHKEYAIKCLLDAFDVLQEALVIGSKRDITANLFSNFIVQYVDKDINEVLQTKLFALTSHGSYLKTRSRFLEKLTSRNLQDTYIGVRKLLNTLTIETERNLREFVESTIRLIVKKNIEDEGGYRYLWKDVDGGNKTPSNEPDMQPYILGHLKVLYEYMGVQISRESVSANGEIDFLVSYSNSKHDLLRVCVELKLAHNKKLEDGLTKQLPTYMRSERAKHGVFVVLWFKSQDKKFECSKPEKHCDIDHLDQHLEHSKLDKNVSILLINCTKPVYPSKL